MEIDDCLDEDEESIDKLKLREGVALKYIVQHFNW